MVDVADESHREWHDNVHYLHSWSAQPSLYQFPVLVQGPTNDPYHYVALNTDPFLGYAGQFGTAGVFNAHLSGEVDADEWLLRTPLNLSDLEHMAMKAMLPLIKAELSLPNSLIELKDFKKLPRLLKEIGKVFKTRLPLRSYFRAAAEGYLNQKFNLEPLLSDICGIYAALTRTEARINDFITRAGRVQQKHFGFNWNEEPIHHSDSFGTPVSLVGRSISFARNVKVPATYFHAELQYNYNYTAYQLEHARINALLDALGFNMNPQIIWNAIPWSFVVDWVLGVSRYLESLQTSNMEPQINIHRYLWSTKRERTITVVRKVAATQWGTTAYPPVESNLPVVYEMAYRRVVTSPSRSLIELGGVSSSEFTLGAALVLAQKRRPKRINLHKFNRT
jgi:hypothetical protein